MLNSNPATIVDEEKGFQDDGIQEEFEVVEDEILRRGKDRHWNLIETFQSNADYEESDLYKLELSKMSMRKARSTLHAERETFECKFARKKSFLSCNLKYRVYFDTSSFEITIEKSGDSHVHEKDPEYGHNTDYNFATLAILS